jgi:hypothetical protein
MADNLFTFICRLSEILGSLIFRSPRSISRSEHEQRAFVRGWANFLNVAVHVHFTCVKSPTNSSPTHVQRSSNCDA